MCIDKKLTQAFVGIVVEKKMRYETERTKLNNR